MTNGYPVPGALIDLVSEEASSIPEGPVIIATGPLTSDKMSEAISNIPGLGTLNFYDAAAPIVFRESLNEDRLFRMSRYNRGNDYLNAPMTEQEYTVFIRELIAAETAEVHGFEDHWDRDGTELVLTAIQFFERLQADKDMHMQDIRVHMVCLPQSYLPLV